MPKTDEMMLKVTFIAYIPVKGLAIEKRVPVNEPDKIGMYLDGKLLQPTINYMQIEGDELCTLPEGIELIEEFSSWTEEFVTREKLWEEEPHLRIADEVMQGKLVKTRIIVKTAGRG